MAHLEEAGFFAETRWPDHAQAAVKAEYAALDEAWITLIKERFNSGNLSDGAEA